MVDSVDRCIQANRTSSVSASVASKVTVWLASGLTCCSRPMASLILACLRQSLVVPLAHAGRKRQSVPPVTGHTVSIGLF